MTHGVAATTCTSRRALENLALAAPHLPPRLEEPDEVLLSIRMVRKPVPVHVDPEPRPVLDRDEPVDHLIRSVDELTGPSSTTFGAEAPTLSSPCAPARVLAWAPFAEDDAHLRRETAVDSQNLPRDERGLRRREECDRRGDLLRRAGPS
jgi:hypothetical protein